MLNEKLLIETLKAMAESNYIIAKDAFVPESLRDRAMKDYMNIMSTLNLVINPKVLRTTAEIYGVEV